MSISKFTGYIPPRIKYVQRAPREVSDYWEHDWLTPEELRRKGVLVSEAFPIDATNKKTLETAMSWAGRRNYYDKGPEIAPKITEVANDPIPTLEIVSLDIRSEGGRAWKVLIHGTYYVDLREDVLLDSLRNGSGVVRGELTGPFVWCIVGSHMKLVRVGSKLHDAVIEAGERRDSKNVTGAALKAGDIYENRKGEKFVFLGLVDSDRYEVTNEDERRRHYSSSNFVPHFKKVEERSIQLWGGLAGYWKSPQELFKVQERHANSGSAGTNLYHITTVKKKAVVGKTGSMKLPADYIEKIRELALLEIRARAAYVVKQEEERRARGLTRSDYNVGLYSRAVPYRNVEEEFGTLVYYGGRCTLRPVGQPCPEIPEIAALNAYIDTQVVTPAKYTTP